MSSSAPPVRTLPQAPGARRAAIRARYPEPPRYADDGKPQPAQPACYGPARPAPRRAKLTGARRALQGRRWPQVWRARG
jgi:hypothetical protein